MNRILSLLFLFPLFLNAQNEEPNKWRFNFSYQYETAGAFEASDTKNWNFFQIERESGNGHSVQLGVERRFSETIGLQYNLSYANRNNIIRTGFNFDGFDCAFPCGIQDVAHFEHQIEFSNVELDAIFFTEQHFNKFGISAGLGFGLGYYLIFETETIDILETSTTFAENIDNNGILNADGFTGFGKMQISFFYNYSESVRLFLRPTFKFDLSKTTSELLYNRFYAFGGAFGISVKL